MLPLVKEMEDYISTMKEDITIAIMGCPVNGIQEAGRADVGVAGGHMTMPFSSGKEKSSAQYLRSRSKKH
jgi:4-hydroxy-3-methylbut-2-en-1-yl diphosphate synthase IspG/GcpE